MKKYKTIIIGCGNIAGGYDERVDAKWPLTHAGAFLAHGGFELIACCDPDREKREAFQNKWGISTGVAYPEDLDTDEVGGVDVVSICSPTAVHVRHLETVSTWGSNLLFCEKPIACDMAEAAHWVKHYQTLGITLVVNHTRRWVPDIQALKAALDEEKWGRLRSVSGIYNKGILNNGSHMVDLILFLLGTVKVLGTGSPMYDYWPEDPSIAALLETQNNIPVTLNIANARDYAIFEMQFVLEKAVITMESGGMTWSHRTIIESLDFPGYRSPGSSSLQPGRYREAMVCAASNIYNVLTSKDAEIPSTGATALQAQTLCQEIRQQALRLPHSVQENNL